MDAIEALAEAWASLDGKLDRFNRERDAPPEKRLSMGGYYDGYCEDAKELIARLEKRGFVLLPSTGDR